MNSSSNPAFSDKATARLSATGAETMTVSGSLGKAAMAIAVLIAAAVFGWRLFPSLSSIPWGILICWFIAMLVIGFVAAFRPNPVTVLAYSVLEGAYLGVISRVFDESFGGIVSQAILLTFAITVGMFILYASGIVKVTQKLRSVILIATVGVVLYIVAEFFLSLFIPSFANFAFTGTSGIVIAAIIVIIAALNLLLDFDFINQGVANKLDKKGEWYFAFGLMVTLVWLYISIIRLLAASRR